jgi:hypothetical protein
MDSCGSVGIGLCVPIPGGLQTAATTSSWERPLVGPPGWARCEGQGGTRPGPRAPTGAPTGAAPPNPPPREPDREQAPTHQPPVRGSAALSAPPRHPAARDRRGQSRPGPYPAGPDRTPNRTGATNATVPEPVPGLRAGSASGLEDVVRPVISRTFADRIARSQHHHHAGRLEQGIHRGHVDLRWPCRPGLGPSSSFSRSPSPIRPPVDHPRTG